MDYALEKLINGPAGKHPFLDAIMRDAATWAVPVFIAIVAAWFAVGWFRGSPRERLGSITALFAAGGALLTNQLILLVWSRPRPFAAHPGTVHTLVARSTDGSFPSDHALASMAIAVVLFHFHRRWGLAAIAAALLVCIARVYVGAHYPGDVAGGALIGAIVASLLLGPLKVIPIRVSNGVTWLMRRLRLPLRDGSLPEAAGDRSPT